MRCEVGNLTVKLLSHDLNDTLICAKKQIKSRIVCAQDSHYNENSHMHQGFIFLLNGGALLNHLNVWYTSIKHYEYYVCSIYMPQLLYILAQTQTTKK